MMDEEELTPSQVLYPEGFREQDASPAQIDWATGIVLYYVPFAETQRIMNADHSSLSERELYQLEVFTHEVTHLLQFL